MRKEQIVALARVMPKLGVRRVLLNVMHRVRHRSGWYERRTPSRPRWTDAEPARYRTAASPFRGAPAAAALRAVVANAEDVIAAGARIVSGDLPYFSTFWFPVPSQWRSDPRTGASALDQHWTRLAFDGDADVKWVWEASRFDWVYLLARAWRLSGDEQFAGTFWRLLDDWRLHNPPNRGVNWNCGQECSLRMLALVWAAAAFRESSTATPERMAILWQTVEALAERVEVSIGYAVSQHNNHGLAEATALYVAGIALPFHHRAAWWRRRGRVLVERQILEQFAADGSYVLHSFNYLREGLRDCVFFLLAQRAAGEGSDAAGTARLAAASRLLLSVMDEGTGRVPNYGANDGANIAALSGPDYDDYRPVAQLVSALAGNALLLPRGPWDEELLWHLGEEALSLPRRTGALRPSAATEGGYYAFRAPGVHALIRCHTYTHRPTHADLLHFDLWQDGVNVLLDSGSYSYHDREQWGVYLERTEAHNTATVDGQDQMRKLARFLWGDWAHARVLRCDAVASPGGEILRFSGEHDGYERLGVIHRRSVLQRGRDFLIVDDFLRSSGVQRTLTVSWHLPAPGAVPMRVYSSSRWTGTCITGEEHYPVTARSLRYGQLSPKTVIRHERLSASNERLITVVGAEEETIQQDVLLWHGLHLSLRSGDDILTLPGTTGIWNALP